ncbi:hypothetical protein CWO89_40460 [Bradyrhizobium sp. Leo170]|nr:hypothetical protein CWO89_40460 [Bradyrhizobium sp. Leo170]
MPHVARSRFAGSAMQRPSWTNNAQPIFSRQIMIRADHDLALCLSMIFSENRFPLFRIML